MLSASERIPCKFANGECTVYRMRPIFRQFQRFHEEKKKLKMRGNNFRFYGAPVLSPHARTASHCSSSVHAAARLSTHSYMGEVVGEGEAMTTSIDSQLLSCVNLNSTTNNTAAGKEDDAVDMNHSSSLSSPIEGFVVQKWMRDRTRVAAPHATAGVSGHWCKKLCAHNMILGAWYTTRHF